MPIRAQSAPLVKATEESLAQTDLNLPVGRAILLDVLDAQNTLAQARLRYAQALVRYNQSQVKTLAALGLLDTASLLGRP
jgi:outer membrane protein TolC